MINAKKTIADFSHKQKQKIFEEIYKDNLHILCLAAFKVLKDKEKANDCVQELFLELWEKDKIKMLADLDDVGAYLYTCILHKSFRILQTENKKVKSIQEMIIIQDKFEEQIHQESQSENIITTATGNMPTQSYRAFQLHVIEGKKRSEIASIMGISINTVKTHLKTAFKIARNNLVKNSEEVHPK